MTGNIQATGPRERGGTDRRVSGGQSVERSDRAGREEWRADLRVQGHGATGRGRARGDGGDKAERAGGDRHKVSGNR